MPKVSKDSAAQVDDHGVVEDRHEDIAGYTVNFVSFRQQIDGTPLLKGLPDDSCQCPHWGYVFSGRVTYRFADHEEVFEAGDAFYLPPGHVPLAEAGERNHPVQPGRGAEGGRRRHDGQHASDAGCLTLPRRHSCGSFACGGRRRLRSAVAERQRAKCPREERDHGKPPAEVS